MLHIISLETPSDPSFSSHSVEIALHSILACRLMIGMREAVQSLGQWETFELSGVPRNNAFESARRSLVESASVDPESYAGPSKT